MIKFTLKSAVLALFASSAFAGVISHNQVTGFPDSTRGYFKTFQPQLKVFDGCVPFPAVDSAGNVSGGLDNTGAMDGRCSSSPGQVYVNQATYQGECAVMYSWYFPKDQNVDGPGNNGHRHDWENVVVWLSSCADNARINAVSYSGHGKYEVSTKPGLDGKHPLVAYQRNPFPLNHSVTSTNTKGGYQPAISWVGLTPAARQTLNTHNFGKANVPFNESNFWNNIKKAYYK
ncbi:NPP1 family protein [Acinetobacter apis]|uniref:Necrosis inducing protein (NPP1) n=1 Tax=Acinetobacter apis TaxID=1229165 RepID=A0A217ED69_9GAMM|nr:NPP1 family protein [Acinetobacter apis]SNQ28459.1 Necrosis inducing protein (NPP1) [Acinetobacter apis]